MRVIIPFIILLAAVGCGSLDLGRRADDTNKQIKKTFNADYKAEQAQDYVPNSQKLMFYVGGIICVAVGIGLAIYFRMPKMGLTSGLSGLACFIIPSFIELIHTIMGPLRWAFYVVIGTCVISFLVLVFVIVRKKVHELVNKKECEYSPQTRSLAKHLKDKTDGTD